MEKRREVVYMVTYFDDNRQQHLIFVKGFSSVKFLIDRFDNVYFEKTEHYYRAEE